MSKKYLPFVVCLQLLTASVLSQAQPAEKSAGKDKPIPQKPADYFPPPESKGGWRKLENPQDIRRLG